jgi:O-antigen/teichoic acid export membrane protein
LAGLDVRDRAYQKAGFLMKLFLRDLFVKLRKSIFFKNIVVVMAGTGVAQVIGVLLSPIISRLFTPADFGVSSSFVVVSSTIATLATMSYDSAIMLPKEKDHAFNIFSLSILSTVTVSIFCLLFCLIAPATVNGLMKTTGTWPLAVLVFAIMIAGINVSCQAWSVRAKAFRQTSASQMIRSLTANGSRIGFGFLKAGAPGLIISGILGDLLASVNLVRVLLPDLRALRGRVRWGLIKRLAREYRDFPMYSASQNFINSVSGSLPVLLLTRFFGISVTGAYAFGMTVLSLPMGLITGALRQVLFQKASESQHQGESLASLYVKITATLFAMALVPSLIVIIWAPQLFTWIFGSQWHLAGELARSLMIWLAFVFCNVPAVLFARIIRIQRFVFLYDLILLAARSAALVIGGLYLSAQQTVLSYALVGAAMNGFLIFWVGRAVMKKEGSLNLDTLRDLLIQD